MKSELVNRVDCVVCSACYSHLSATIGRAGILGLAAGTVNQRLAAVRRLAYEAADSGLLSPELAGGIRHVKGAKQLAARMENWLAQDQAQLLLEKADGD